MTDDPLTDAASAEERAANGEAPPEPEELFPKGVLDGEGPTPQTIIRRNLPIELTVSLGKAEVPLRGGLLDPNRYGRVLVTYLPAKLDEVPKREDDHDDARVTGWKLRQNLRATFVETADDVERLIEREFDSLLESDRAAAGRLLNRLTTSAAEVGAVTRAA